MFAGRALNTQLAAPTRTPRPTQYLLLLNFGIIEQITEDRKENSKRQNK